MQSCRPCTCLVTVYEISPAGSCQSTAPHACVCAGSTHAPASVSYALLCIAPVHGCTQVPSHQQAITTVGPHSALHVPPVHGLVLLRQLPPLALVRCARLQSSIQIPMQPSLARTTSQARSILLLIVPESCTLYVPTLVTSAPATTSTPSLVLLLVSISMWPAGAALMAPMPLVALVPSLHVSLAQLGLSATTTRILTTMATRLTTRPPCVSSAPLDTTPHVQACLAVCLALLALWQTARVQPPAPSAPGAPSLWSASVTMQTSLEQPPQILSSPGMTTLLVPRLSLTPRCLHRPLARLSHKVQTVGHILLSRF